MGQIVIYRAQLYSMITALAVFVAAVAYTGPAEAADGVVFLQPTVQLTGSRRVALVIGNGAYTNVPRLKNTVQDADSVATKLRSLGYQIEYAQNVDRRAMNEAITGFLSRIEPGMEATVYYAGHGVELNGANFLLPTDVPALDPEQERMLRTEGVNVNDLLLDITDRHANVTLVILDACRDNPFHVAGTYGTYRSLGSTRGLGNVSPPRGSFVIFSAGAGEEALDNLGSSDPSPNGLFTRKLLALMDKDGLELRELVRELRVEVSDAASTTPDHHSQIPGYYDQMLGDFYFRPRNAPLTPAVSMPPSELQKTAPLPLPAEERQATPTIYPAPQPVAPSPQKFAYAYTPPVEYPAPPVVTCRPGEERRDEVCQPMACAQGSKRNASGMCVRVPPHLGRRQAIVPKVKVASRLKVVAAFTHKRSVSSGNCFTFNGMQHCD